jgi:hypothetical protein
MDLCFVEYRLDHHDLTETVKLEETVARQGKRDVGKQWRLVVVRRQDVTGYPLWEMG